MSIYEVLIILLYICAIIVLLCVFCSDWGFHGAIHNVSVTPKNINISECDVGVTEHFFGENIPANPELIKSGLALDEKEYKNCVNISTCQGQQSLSNSIGVHKGVERLFDYSNRFIDDQFESSRIYILPPTQPGEAVCS